MHVCLCKGINDKVIHQAVVSGEVNSMRDLRQQYGVASQCGCCKTAPKMFFTKPSNNVPIKQVKRLNFRFPYATLNSYLVN